MKVGFIGKGRVAQALAKALRARHDVRFGVREPTQEDHGSLAEVANWADVVIVTTPWSAMESVASGISTHASGKPIIDATNPIAMAAHGPDLAGDAVPSAAEMLQRKLPAAHVVKAFNQIGAEFMAAPEMLADRPAMLVAGDDETAKTTALTLISDAGFEAVDAGPLANAKHLESLALLWIWQAIKGPLGRTFGFALTHIKTEGND